MRREESGARIQKSEEEKKPEPPYCVAKQRVTAMITLIYYDEKKLKDKVQQINLKS